MSATREQETEKESQTEGLRGAERDEASRCSLYPPATSLIPTMKDRAGCALPNHSLPFATFHLFLIHHLPCSLPHCSLSRSSKKYRQACQK